MTEQTNPPKESKEDRTRTKVVNRGASVPVYGLGFIGALVYFIQHAATVGAGLLGILKAMVWPALVVYRLLEFLKM